MFFCGVLKRAVWYIPPLVLDPFDVAGKVFNMDWIVQQQVALSLFVLGWVIAVILTYHEVRMQNVRLELDVTRAGRIGTLTSRVLHPKKRLRFYDNMAVDEIERRMRAVHWHCDVDVIKAEMLNGRTVGEIMADDCTICGKPRNQERDD